MILISEFHLNEPIPSKVFFSRGFLLTNDLDEKILKKELGSTFDKIDIDSYDYALIFMYADVGIQYKQIGVRMHKIGDWDKDTISTTKVFVTDRLFPHLDLPDNFQRLCEFEEQIRKSSVDLDDYMKNKQDSQILNGYASTHLINRLKEFERFTTR